MIPPAQSQRGGAWETLVNSPPGAFLLGLLFGGLPLLLAASWLRGGIFSYKYTLFIGVATPFWMIVCGVIAALGRDRNYWPIIARSSSACVAAAVPIPSALFGVLGFAERGAQIYDRQNLPFLIPFLTVWALIVVDVPAVVVALIIRTVLQSRKR